ncbi:MAG: excinuclease ABC subunit UvrB [Salinibacter sp.]
MTEVVDQPDQFDLVSDFEPMGDQPNAIRELVDGVERGDEYQTLLGATGTGKSLGYDDPVYLTAHSNGDPETRVEAIGPVVDRLIEEYGSVLVGDTEETLLPKGEYSTLAFDAENGRVEETPVRAVTRHEAPNEMYRLTTDCGRSATMTGDHNLWVLRDGQLQLIETAEAQPSDCVPVPATLPQRDGIDALDTVEALARTNLYVKAAPALQAYLAEEDGSSLAEPLRNAGIDPYPKIASIRGRTSGDGGLSTKVYQQVLKKTEELGGHAVDQKIEIGGKQEVHRLPGRLELTPNVLQLFGLYVAEGHGADRFVLFANENAEVRQSIEGALQSLGLPYSERPSSDLQVGSKALTELLKEECGARSQAKRLPSFWPQLSNRDLGLLLQGYFDGDGTVARANAVTATTASKKLASDLTYALSRLGIWARIRPVEKEATNSAHEGGRYYMVTVSGQRNLRQFDEYVGFSIEQKQVALQEHLKKNANSNVDVVPIQGEVLRRIRRAVGLSAEALGARCERSRSAVQFYETGERRPPRRVLRAMLRELKDAAGQVGVGDEWRESWRSLRQLCDVQWTPIASVEAVEYEYEYVYDLSVPGPETFLAGEGGFFVHNTYTIANVIEEVNKPTLVMSHNKTLAAQLYGELKQFFPNNAVEYFISYYDYYQPESYIVPNDTYIEKDVAINDRIERLRLRATSELVSGRDDVIVVASVSCIYGLGSPAEFRKEILRLQRGQEVERNDLLRRFIDLFYERNDIEFTPGTFRVRGDVVDIFPAYREEVALRVEFWGDEIDRLALFEPESGREIEEIDQFTLYPAQIFVTPEDRLERAIEDIKEELRWRLSVLREEGKMVEAQRLEQRTMFDIEMMQEVGYCSGIENYSRHLTGREPGDRPYCLLDYFPDDFQLVVDESHVTIPQVRAMYNGDRQRKLKLVEHGFRLPSALDNRPLTFEEFEELTPQTIFMSATPADYELEQSGGVIVEQVVRPTGIPDPEIDVRPTENQVDDLMEEIRKRAERDERVLVTTLTKRMTEDLADYLDSYGVDVRWMHSDIDALERVDIIRGLRLGEYDVLVGVNLLREGLDLPEVSLVAILDADQQGFLRSETSLIQTAGRAARNVNGQVILYADEITDAMQKMIDETERRREIQLEYNETHDVTPEPIVKSPDQIRQGTAIADEKSDGEDESGGRHHYGSPDQLSSEVADPVVEYLSDDQKQDLIEQMKAEMEEAAENLEFERAAELRDSIEELEEELEEGE